MMEELPVNWSKVELAHVCELVNGDRGKNYPSKDKLSKEGFPFVNAGNLKNNRISSETMNFIDEYRFGLLNSGKFGVDDILFCIRGSLGKVALNTYIEKGVIASSLIIVRPYRFIDTKYALYYLASPLAHNMINKFDNGTAQPNLSGADLGRFEFPLAPLNEQKRIVAKIEELFSELDKGIESLKTAREQLKVYRQAVLKQAFEGRLTAEWRQSHGVLFEGWKKSLVHDVASVGTGATPKRGDKRYYEDGKHAWVTSGALNEDYVTQASEYITDTALDETNCRLYPPNTILVAMYGEGKTRGKASILKITAATNQACAAINITDDSVLLGYLWNFFKYNYGNIRQQSSGGVQPNLNLSHIKSITFPLPSIDEQIAINEQIEIQFSSIYKIQEEIEQNLQKAEALRQSILKKAFSGKLVAQDPNDEPASVLLERIRAEKESPVQQSWLPQVDVKEEENVA